MCSRPAFQACSIYWSLIWTLSDRVAGVDLFTHFAKSQHYLLPFEKPREATEGDQTPGHVLIPK